MNEINNNDRDRGLEVLFYKKEAPKEPPVTFQFKLNKIFYFFHKEFSFNIEFLLKPKK